MLRGKEVNPGVVPFIFCNYWTEFAFTETETPVGKFHRGLYKRESDRGSVMAAQYPVKEGLTRSLPKLDS